METRILLAEPIYKGRAMQLTISGRHSDFLLFAEKQRLSVWRCELMRNVTTIWVNDLTITNARELVRMYNKHLSKQCTLV